MDLHLGKLNPLNIGQGNKVQHPKKPGYSNTISQNVEGMHREFVGFQNNLKQLVTMYKTRQELMEALNENGLYVSCFDVFICMLQTWYDYTILWSTCPICHLCAPDNMCRILTDCKVF